MMKNIKTSLVIPAKGSSERVKNKNLYKINNKSLIFLACEKALKCKRVKQVFVDTESAEIKEDLKPLIKKGLKVIDRPKELANNQTSGNDLARFEKEFVKDQDLYIQTFATSPLLKHETIDKCIQQFIEKWDKYDSFLSVTKLQEYIWDENGTVNFNLDNLPNSKDLKGFWKETHGLYGVKVECLKKNNKRLGEKPMLVEINEEEALDIDNYCDIEYLEYINAKQKII